jgi:carbon-monoxide dehydrogenase large subunit
MHKTYDSGQFELVMNKAIALAEWEGFAARAADAKTRRRLRGRGMATFLEWTGADVFEERVTVTVSATDENEGEIEIFNALQAMGQGLATTFAQVAVDVFGVPIGKIRIVQGDTDRGTGFGSAGSRSLFVGGSAVRVAAERTIDKAQQLAAEELEAAAADIEYSDGVFSIAGTDRRIGLFSRAKQPSRRIVLTRRARRRSDVAQRLPHLRGVEVDGHRRGGGGRLLVGQRCPRRQPDDRHRAARGGAAQASGRRCASASSTTANPARR